MAFLTQNKAKLCEILGFEKKTLGAKLKPDSVSLGKSNMYVNS
jgi:hypothetical protein